MFENRINNIIDGNGIDGWETIGELEYLEKTFTFAGFEASQDFIDKVGQFAEKNDHHPEWKLTNAGCTVEVRLTSHFNNDHLSLADFELAQAMNKIYSGSGSKLPSPQVWHIGILAALGVYGIYSLYLAETYPGITFKAHPEPSLSKLVAAPNWKVDNLSDVDAIVAKHLDQKSLAETQKPFQ